MTAMVPSASSTSDGGTDQSRGRTEESVVIPTLRCCVSDGCRPGARSHSAPSRHTHTPGRVGQVWPARRGAHCGMTLESETVRTSIHDGSAWWKSAVVYQVYPRELRRLRRGRHR